MTSSASEPHEEHGGDAVDVAVGAHIVYSKYGGAEITIDGEDLLVLDARDVLLVAERGTADAEHEARHRNAASRVGSIASRLDHLLTAVDALRADEAASQRDALLKAMMTAGVDPVPTATFEQTRRLARQRDRLLATGAYATEHLQEIRGDASPSATRTWLARQRNRKALFSVGHNGSTWVPAFQLDAVGQPRAAVRRVLEALEPAGLAGWATWTWFTSPSAWTGGDSPIDVLAADPDRAVRAAARFASNAHAEG